MQKAYEAKDLLQAMLDMGNKPSITDAGVGALCCLTAIEGAYMNVRVNTKDLKDKEFAQELNTASSALYKQAKEVFGAITDQVHSNIV